jgi:hypothetical protein
LEAEAQEDNPKVKEIPAQFFRESFSMADPTTFQSIVDTYSYQLLLEKVPYSCVQIFIVYYIDALVNDLCLLVV